MVPFDASMMPPAKIFHYSISANPHPHLAGSLTASIFAFLAIRVQLESDAAFAAIAAQSIHAFMFTSVLLVSGAFIEFFDEVRRESCLLDGTVGDELDEHLV